MICLRLVRRRLRSWYRSRSPVPVVGLPAPAPIPFPTRSRSRCRAARELYFWLRNPDASNFTARLYGLITKADCENLHRLAVAFPDEVFVWREWHTSENLADFFQSYGVVVTEDKKC